MSGICIENTLKGMGSLTVPEKSLFARQHCLRCSGSIQSPHFWLLGASESIWGSWSMVLKLARQGFFFLFCFCLRTINIQKRHERWVQFLSEQRNGSTASMPHSLDISGNGSLETLQGRYQITKVGLKIQLSTRLLGQPSGLSDLTLGRPSNFFRPHTS